MTHTTKTTSASFVSPHRPGVDRIAALLAVPAVLVAVLLGSTTPPAWADDAGTPAQGTIAETHAATRSNWDIVIGSIAGAAMLGVAGAVLWHTARNRHAY